MEEKIIKNKEDATFLVATYSIEMNKPLDDGMGSGKYIINLQNNSTHLDFCFNKITFLVSEQVDINHQDYIVTKNSSNYVKEQSEVEGGGKASIIFEDKTHISPEENLEFFVTFCSAPWCNDYAITDLQVNGSNVEITGVPQITYAE